MDYYKEDIAAKIAMAGPCECCGEPQAELGSRCHPGEGVRVLFEHGLVKLYCSVCEKEVMEIEVASRNNTGG